MRRTAATIGALFWISNVSVLAGSAITGSVPNAADAVATLSSRGAQEVVGTLVAHINDAAIIGYAVVLFAVLRRYSDALALAYVAFKVVEAVMLVVAAAAFLSLIPLSERYVAGGARDASVFQVAAELALAQQFWASRLAAIAYIVATPILAFLLYQTRLVPRFISIWGFIAVALLALGLALGIPDPTRGFHPGQLLLIPIILWELFFATWLIARGFSSSAAS